MVIACRFSFKKFIKQNYVGYTKTNISHSSMIIHTLYAPYFAIQLRLMFAPWVQKNHALTLGLTMPIIVASWQLLA